MPGKSPKVKQDPAERAQARSGANMWNDYVNRIAPLQDRYRELSAQTAGGDQLAASRATAAAEAGAVGSSRAARLAARQGGISGLADGLMRADVARGRGQGTVAAVQSNEDTALGANLKFAGLGRNLQLDANAANSSLSQSRATAAAEAARSAALQQGQDMNVLGTLAGAGVANYFSQPAATAGKIPMPVPTPTYTSTPDPNG